LNLNLSNLNVVIVGGTNGIGYAIAKGFLEEGAITHIISRNRNQKAEQELNNFGKGNVFFYNGDALNYSNLNSISEKISNNNKTVIDVVISNVGNGSGSRLPVGPKDEWENSWAVNFDSALNVVRVFSNKLIRSKGSLIFISSIAGIEFLGAPTSYSTAKSALISFGKALSHRMAPDVRVNVVAPGNILVENGMWDKKMKENSEQITLMLEQKVPLKRFGHPEEISNLVLFLSSNKAAFITGGCFVVDGGQTVSF